MPWPFQPKRRPPETWHAPKIQFVGEQDGTPERKLKEAWIKLLRVRPHVRRAYLARAVFSDQDFADVVLAIFATTDSDNELLEELGKVFADTFRPDIHLDIMLLSSAQEAELSKVCRPFYQP